MTNKNTGENLDGLLTQYSNTKKTVNQVLTALSSGIVNLVKNPFKGLKNKLISLITILLLFFNPIWGKDIVRFIFEEFGSQYPNHTNWLDGFWKWWPYLFTGTVLLALVVMVWEQLKQKSLLPTQFRNPAVKGLLSFDQSDNAIFKRLQREADIQMLTSALTNRNFRFGILTGVSGCGKTSLLNAGLLPSLAGKKQRAVIVTLTDESPLESIQKALARQLGIIFNNEEDYSLQRMLDMTLETAENIDFILILDQFEQFFTQNRLEEERKPFILDLCAVYQNFNQVKILISIRLDFMGRLHEIQQHLQYSITADQNYFDLKKFTPQQAVQIFFVMREEGHTETFDHDFMLKLSRTELASKEDGRVSAADIQWVATALQQSENFDYDEHTFQRNGGVKGMMQQYLQKLLETPNYFNRNQEALKVLLTFVDLDNNTRKGRLSSAHIIQLLNGQVSIDYLALTLEWLTQNRLLFNPGDDKDGKPAWELVHERLIEPLRMIANVVLPPLGQDQLLLERRTNEWLANNKEKRFLLTRKEYYRCKKNISFLLAGPNRIVKEELWEGTKKRVMFWNHIATVLGFIFLSYFLSYLGYRSIYFKMEVQSKNEVDKLIMEKYTNASDEVEDLLSALSQVNAVQALELTKGFDEEHREEAYRRIWTQFKEELLKNNDREKKLAAFVDFLADPTFIAVADSLPQFFAAFYTKTEKDIVMHRIQESAKKIKDPELLTRVFLDLAEAASFLGIQDSVKAFLQQAKSNSKNNFSYIRWAGLEANIGSLDSAMLKLQDIRLNLENFIHHAMSGNRYVSPGGTLINLYSTPEQRLENRTMLDALIQVTSKIPNPDSARIFFRHLCKDAANFKGNRSRPKTFLKLAKVASKVEADSVQSFFQQAWTGAEKLPMNDQQEISFEIIKTATKFGYMDLSRFFIMKTAAIENKIEDSVDYVLFFNKLAEVSVDVEEDSVAPFLLKAAQGATKVFNSQRSRLFADLSVTAIKLNQKDLAKSFFNESIKMSNEVKDSLERIEILCKLSDLAVDFGMRESAQSFLQQATDLARNRNADIYNTLISSVLKLGKSDWVEKYLAEIETVIDRFYINGQHLELTRILSGLSKAYADIGCIKKSYALAGRIEDRSAKAYALIYLQKRYAQQ